MNKTRKKILNKENLQEIKKYFEAPEPVRKQEFIKKTAGNQYINIRKKTGFFYILWVQFSYISKWLWVLSAVLFAGIFIASRYIASELVWCVSGIIPFIVTFTLSESVRSIIYGMNELEMSSRFTLKSIIMSRVIIIGAVNMSLVLFTELLSGDLLWRNIIYMLVPYLSSATGGFIILRKFTSKEGVYLSSGFGIIISLLDIRSTEAYTFIYDEKYTGIWVIAAIMFSFTAIYESYKMAGTVGSRI